MSRRFVSRLMARTALTRRQMAIVWTRARTAQPGRWRGSAAAMHSTCCPRAGRRVEAVQRVMQPWLMLPLPPLQLHRKGGM
jgi:hypothetical protein